ncbi:MAG: phage portal protein, partial [candidate division Zixibacteria bacterium]|nr:phage portal protein [candidate division Zixibacteria bacterium]
MITINTTDIQDYNVDSGAIVVNRPAPKGPKSPRLRNYETALTNDDNSNQWAYATAGDADSFIQPALSTIRNRTRYIQRNSPLVNGIISTFAANVVGKGPRLQFIP